jgi:signal transduction histidine kinase
MGMDEPPDTHAELIRRLEDAERRGKIGLLVPTVVHDSNNLLTAIMNSAAVLSKHRSAEIAERACVILSCCTRLASMLRRLQLQSTCPCATQTNTVLAALVPTLCSLVGPQIRVTTRFEEPLPKVLIDPCDLERIALNLAANARDALPRGGSMVVSTTRVRKGGDDGEPPRDWVLVEFSDNGTGMDKSELACACEPLFTTKLQGQGLGLCSVNRAVHAAGGRMDIKSTVGLGTTVQIWLTPCPEDDSHDATGA